MVRTYIQSESPGSSGRFYIRRERGHIPLLRYRIRKNRLLLTKNASDSDKAMLEKAILRAEQSLSSVTAPEILDYNTYLLYLVLNGSGEDIGARFAGFDYPGFGK